MSSCSCMCYITCRKLLSFILQVLGQRAASEKLTPVKRNTVSQQRHMASPPSSILPMTASQLHLSPSSADTGSWSGGNNMHTPESVSHAPARGTRRATRASANPAAVQPPGAALASISEDDAERAVDALLHLGSEATPQVSKLSAVLSPKYLWH